MRCNTSREQKKWNKLIQSNKLMWRSLHNTPYICMLWSVQHAHLSAADRHISRKSHTVSPRMRLCVAKTWKKLENAELPSNNCIVFAALRVSVHWVFKYSTVLCSTHGNGTTLLCCCLFIYLFVCLLVGFSFFFSSSMNCDYFGFFFLKMWSHITKLRGIFLKGAHINWSLDAKSK